MKDKIDRAKQYLGSKWVLAKNSTYDGKRREHSGCCVTLRPIVLKAMIAGTL